MYAFYVRVLPIVDEVLDLVSGLGGACAVESLQQTAIKEEVDRAFVG